MRRTKERPAGFYWQPVSPHGICLLKSHSHTHFGAALKILFLVLLYWVLLLSPVLIYFTLSPDNGIRSTQP